MTERYTEEGAAIGWGDVGVVPNHNNYAGTPALWHRTGQQIREITAKQIFLGHRLLDGTSQTFIQFVAWRCPFQLFGDFHTGMDELTVELHENRPDGNNDGFEFSAEKKYFDDGETEHQFLFKLFVPNDLVKNIIASMKIKELETLNVTLNFSEIPGLYENADEDYFKLLDAETKVHGLQSKTKTDVFDTESGKSFYSGQIVSVNAFERQYFTRHQSVETLLAGIQYELQQIYQRPR
ncbi:hypothetical protein OAO72_06210 [Alphaproteobacteria bacterium]|nr:hypothetical protein [Alphaproteobacteria bacterium]